MAYEAHKWKIGEEITSDKLNHIEKGIEEAGLPREITNPQDGQTLKYDAASGKWVNGEGGSGGSSTLVVTKNGTTLDKTWQEIADAFPNVVIRSVSPMDETQYTDLTVKTVSNMMSEFVIELNDSESSEFVAQSASDYPELKYD